MPAPKTKLIEQVLEIRYDRGYRFFDRSGEVMLILEDILTKDTGKVWMADEIKPTGATLKCPDLDMLVAVDSAHAFVTQNPCVVECNFDEICRTAWTVIQTRFALDSLTRAGCRRKASMPASDITESERLAVKYAPFKAWPIALEGSEFSNAEVTGVWESPDRRKGVRTSTSVVANLGAPLEIDDRLRLPPHLQNKNQSKALLEQLARRKQQNLNPDVGFVIDVDYYELFPEKFSLAEFLKSASQEQMRQRDGVLKGGVQ